MVRFVCYRDDMTLYADINLEEWEEDQLSINAWTQENGWRIADRNETLRSMMIAPRYTTRTVVNGRRINVWAIP